MPTPCALVLDRPVVGSPVPAIRDTGNYHTWLGFASMSGRSRGLALAPKAAPRCQLAHVAFEMLRESSEVSVESYDLLQEAMTQANVVLVVGTGVTASMTQTAPTSSWVGLVESGIDRVVQLGQPDSGWQALARSLLDYGKQAKSVQSLIQAASQVKQALQDHGAQAYMNWLRDSVGSLAAEDSGLGEALLRLPFPILTTNYDTLLELVGNRQSATWRDHAKMQRILSGADTNEIGHLHGVWTDPDSVVLSTEDYSMHSTAHGMQALQKGMIALKTMVYVGFGSGLADPNFGSLLMWHRSVFTNALTTHLRLCRKSEVGALNVEHAADNIVPVPYGVEYADLPAYLASLIPASSALVLTSAGIAKNPTTEALEALTDQLRDDAIIGEAAPECVEPGAWTLPPPLLPVPHHEYVRAKSKRGAKRIERVAIDEDIATTGLTLIVAGEGDGLSTALRWLAWQAALAHGVAPICISFRECSSGPRPLERRVRAIARQTGLLSQRDAPLPRFVLSVDDFTPYVAKISDNALVELSTLSMTKTFLGCRQEDAEEVLGRLKAIGIDPAVRYLGRLESRDVRQLARIASPSNYERLTNQVVKTLLNNDLPPTPFAVSLLICVLARGGILSASASQTAVLEQYVSLLLGRGDPLEDSRFEIDQSGREALLSHLAEHFVRQGAEALREADVIQVLSDTFGALGWKESPTRLLNSLLQRRVLKHGSGDLVLFSQNSYLYLFAAKRAQASGDFMKLLLARPLYYSPILISYAALQRRDSDLLVKLQSLITNDADSLTETPTFEILDLEEPADEGSPEESSEDRKFEGADQESMPDPLELNDNLIHVELFSDESSLPRPVRLYRTVALVSVVLRDSDQVENLNLKTLVLLDVLAAWGELMRCWGEDEMLHDMIIAISKELDDVSGEDAAGERFIDFLERTLPAVLGFGGIAGTLASRRLTVSLDQAISEPQLAEKEDARVAAAFLALSTADLGWPKRVSRLLAGMPNLWVVRHFFLWLCESEYSQTDLNDADAAELLSLCGSIRAKGTQFKTNQDRDSFVNHYRSELERKRLVARVRQVAPPAIGASDLPQ